MDGLAKSRVPPYYSQRTGHPENLLRTSARFCKHRFLKANWPQISPNPEASGWLPSPETAEKPHRGFLLRPGSRRRPKSRPRQPLTLTLLQSREERNCTYNIRELSLAFSQQNSLRGRYGSSRLRPHVLCPQTKNCNAMARTKSDWTTSSIRSTIACIHRPYILV